MKFCIEHKLSARMAMDLEKEAATIAMTSREREGGGGRQNAWNQYSYLSLSRPTHVSYS